MVGENTPNRRYLYWGERKASETGAQKVLLKPWRPCGNLISERGCNPIVGSPPGLAWTSVCISEQWGSTERS